MPYSLGFFDILHSLEGIIGECYRHFTTQKGLTYYMWYAPGVIHRLAGGLALDPAAAIQEGGSPWRHSRKVGI